MSDGRKLVVVYLFEFVSLSTYYPLRGREKRKKREKENAKLSSMFVANLCRANPCDGQGVASTVVGAQSPLLIPLTPALSLIHI